MADTNTNQNTSAQPEGGAQTDQNGQNSTPAAEDKKYTDNELNDIVKKNSEKAVAKLMKELGITDKEKAKSVLAKAAEEDAKNAAQTGNADDSAHKAELAKAQENYELAMLENVFLTANVQPSKVEKAVKLIDLEKCRDEDGSFSRDKAKAEIDALLKDWPELAVKTENTNVGFQIGSDGQTNKGGSNAAKSTAPVKQKSWNRWN